MFLGPITSLLKTHLSNFVALVVQKMCTRLFIKEQVMTQKYKDSYYDYGYHRK